MGCPACHPSKTTVIELSAQQGTVSATAEVEDEPVLRTRRADLHGRTPNQTTYLNDILEHDITFAIGPAGTGKTYLAVACAVAAAGLCIWGAVARAAAAAMSSMDMTANAVVREW